MKKIIAIVVCIILVVAIGLSLHVSGALGDTANAPGNSVNIPQSTIDAAQSSGGLPDISITLPTTDTSSFDQLPTLTAGCDTSALSGAVARAAGSVGKAVLNQLPYNLGSIYNAATGKGSANINAFGIASQYLNNKNLPPIISDILNDPAVAKAANNAANNFINGLFNSGSSKDVAESVAGKLGVVSGALGTSEIPVADSTLQKEGRAIQSNTQLIQSNTQSIQQDQATQRDVTCIGNVLVRAAANKFAAAQAAAVIADVAQGNGGDSRFPASQADTEAKIGQAVSKYVVNTVLPQYSDSPYLQLGQNAVSVDSQATAVDPITCPVPANIVLACYGDPSRKIQGNFASCGSDYATRMETWYDIETIKQCTLSGYVQAARDLASTLKEYRIQEENTLLAQGNGLMSPTTCLDPGSDPNTPDYNCVNIKTKTPPAVYSSIVANAANSGTKQQSDANQIGGLVGKTFEQLALNELQSLINLTRSTNGAPSYVAQLGQESTTLNSSTLSGTVDTTLKSSIGLEVTYESLLYGEIQDLQSAKAQLQGLNACYLKLQGGSSTTTPSDPAKQASNTITSVIDPLLLEKNTELADSENVLAELSAYENRAQGQSDPASVASAYKALSDSNAIHTTADIAQASNEKDQNEAQLSTLLSGLSSDDCKLADMPTTTPQIETPIKISTPAKETQ